VFLKCRISKPYSVGEEGGYADAVLKRSCFAWLVLGRQRIGAFELNEYDLNGCGTNAQVQQVMDVDEEFEAKLAAAVCHQWKRLLYEVTPDGPILDFRCAWITPRLSDGNLFEDAARSLISVFSPAHSVLIMKAFPLEYEGEVPEGSDLRQALDRRRRAMIRYYRKIFNVRPFRGKYGNEGWLWRRRAI
jgi:hypothetical protein